MNRQSDVNHFVLSNSTTAQFEKVIRQQLYSFSASNFVPVYRVNVPHQHSRQQVPAAFLQPHSYIVVLKQLVTDWVCT